MVIPGSIVAQSHVQSQAEAPPEYLIDFELKDQFGDKHVREDLAGRVTVLIASDKDGSKYNKEWAQVIAKRIVEAGRSPTVRLLGLGDVHGVPFFLKRYVRSKFPKNKNEPVLMDWDGLFAKTYDLVEKETNILVFDPDYTLRLQTSVTTMDSTELEFIMDEIEAAASG